jgi:hypothetical protein
MSAKKREMNNIHVISIVSKDPDSHLPAEMKEYYEAKDITFAEFPLHPIGRAKNLMDEMPDAEEFFKNQPLPQKEGPVEMPMATLIGEYYCKKGKKLAKLGHLKDLIK